MPNINCSIKELEKKKLLYIFAQGSSKIFNCARVIDANYGEESDLYFNPCKRLLLIFIQGKLLFIRNSGESLHEINENACFSRYIIQMHRISYVN